MFVILGLMVIVVAACGNKENGGSVFVENQEDPLQDIVWKKSLTVEDLDRIDEFRFPESYKYIKYDWDKWDSNVETWEYVYSGDMDNIVLLPIHENMVDREVINSEVENNLINTTVDIVLKNGESYPVKYVNDPETLQYLWATLNTPTSTILYTFEY